MSQRAKLAASGASGGEKDGKKTSTGSKDKENHISLEGINFGTSDNVLPGRQPTTPTKFIDKYKNHLTKEAMLRELEKRWPDVPITKSKPAPKRRGVAEADSSESNSDCRAMCAQPTK